MNIFITQDKIKKRVKELSLLISSDYPDKELMLISILKGSFIFTSDLFRELSRVKNNISVDFIRAKSYSGKHSSGILNIDGSIPNVCGKNIIIVEDILDTGFTLEQIYHKLLSQKPESLEIIVLINKKSYDKLTIPIKYSGFTLEDDKFIVGYGLDYNEKYRGLPDIYTID